MIAPQLAAFLEEGLAIHVGSRSADLEPNGVRAAAVKVDAQGTHLVVYVPAVDAAGVLSDLQANGQAAVVVSRPMDERTVQVKGTFVDARDALDDEQSLVQAQRDGYVACLGLIGISRDLVARWPLWPVVAIRIRVTAVFEQTPGAGAGAPLS